MEFMKQQSEILDEKHIFAKLQEKEQLLATDSSIKNSKSQLVTKKRGRKRKYEQVPVVIKTLKSKQVRWNRSQDLIYINFMKKYKELFLNQSTRRVNRVYMKLSKTMNGHRTPNQCKSHHQKMQKVTNQGTVDEIIEYLENKYSATPVRPHFWRRPIQPSKQVVYESQKKKYRVQLSEYLEKMSVRIVLNLGAVGAW